MLTVNQIISNIQIWTFKEKGERIIKNYDDSAVEIELIDGVRETNNL